MSCHTGRFPRVALISRAGRSARHLSLKTANKLQRFSVKLHELHNSSVNRNAWCSKNKILVKTYGQPRIHRTSILRQFPSSVGKWKSEMNRFDHLSEATSLIRFSQSHWTGIRTERQERTRWMIFCTRLVVFQIVSVQRWSSNPHNAWRYVLHGHDEKKRGREGHKGRENVRYRTRKRSKN